MNYLTLDQSIVTGQTTSESFYKSIKLENNKRKNSKNLLLLDDGSPSSKAAIKQLLNLSNQDLRLEVHYLGSLVNSAEIDLSEIFQTLTINFDTVICIGFDGIEFKETIESITSTCNLCSSISATATGSDTYLGYQRHLRMSNSINTNPLSLGLGDLKSNPELVELAFRNQEFIDCNLNVLKRSELPSNKTTHINGIYSEDFCKALKICGSTAKTQILKISGLSEKQDDLESELVADSIWYYLEGTNLNLYESPEDSTGMKEILLQSSDLDHDYTFVRSKQSNKLWFKYTSDNETKYIPCSESDYQKICQDEIPDRIINFI